MKTRDLYIKNMVCARCIKVVREELDKLGYGVQYIELGKVEIFTDQKIDETLLKKNLAKEGFELLEDEKLKIINRIKSLIIDHIHYNDEKPSLENFSQTITEDIGRDYSYLSNLFSTTEGKTIEKFIILQKIEKVKELLKYGELTVNEIAWKLNYSSAQYLSNQFKQVTGITPSKFRVMMNSERKQLDKI